MKKSLLIIIVIAFISEGCATVFGGRVSSCQRTRPEKGQPSREIKVGALICDLIFFWPGLAIDFATGAIYQPCDEVARPSPEKHVGTYEIQSTKPIDTVWSNIIDLFATKGLSIKIIDKSSGLIVSDKTSFRSSYSYHDKRGKIINPDAFVLVNGIRGTQPEVVVGEWNIRIKQSESKTLINVNLVNLDASYTSAYSPFSVYHFDAESTGNFEKMIAEIIK